MAEKALENAIDDVNALEPTEPPQDPPQLEVSKPPLSRWPWIATFLLALAAFAVLIFFLDRAWGYVTTTSEAVERADWDQLIGLVDRIETLALLVLGAVLGVATASGTAALANKAASTNADEAKKQHTAAQQSAASAASANLAAKEIATAASALTDEIDALEKRRADPGDESVWVAQPAMLGLTGGGTPLRPLDREDYEPVDPELQELRKKAAALKAALARFR